ncbi:DUF262 domain-containing protein [Vibrio lentus]|uniref:DUF262 domain-containing protein n=1 Tax=Vibrio lentus TaxID=136468 RepID=A0A2N7BKP2_9VIBR|nr:DUF262 domain-containing protein [Vibrio lentus]PME55963.1 hypothetical protein BCV34_19765 [Vibrio lentus]PME58582.1 hypothetical protein BCV30_16365 [Vibrio lentus]PME77997.1 hypothetical protein BCV27_18350 [Vibrio lentus]
MKVTPEYKSFGELFHESNVFETPMFQRDYSWEGEQIEQFTNDIKEALDKKSEEQDYQHFFGGIVCAQEEGVGNRKIVNALIDGQQRLSTIVMFFSRLNFALKNLECDGEDLIFKGTLQNLMSKYLKYTERKNRESVFHPRLTIGVADNEFFQSVINSCDVESERDSHKLIKSASNDLYNFIINDLFSNKTVTEVLDIVDDIISIFEESFLLIHIITTSVDDAYKLFMVLNDRGLNLTEGELLKAHTLGNYDPKNPLVSQMAKDWDYILSHEANKVSDYLRWSATMIKGRHITANETLEEFKSGYFENSLDIEEMAKNVKSLRKSVFKLSLISEAEWPYERSEKYTSFHSTKLEWLIKKLKHTHAMPLLLASSYLDEKLFQSVINETVKFFIRYKVISNLHASVFSKVYPSLAKSIHEDSDNFNIKSLHETYQKQLDSKDPNDLALETGIRSMYYQRKGDNRPLKYLLITLQENWAWVTDGYKTGPENRLKREDITTVFDFNNTSLEHLYPYSAKPEDVSEDMEAIKNSVGNLVLLDLDRNRSNDNKIFEEKRDAFDNTGIGVHKLVFDSESWGNEEAKVLEEKYLECAKRVFCFKRIL